MTSHLGVNMDWVILQLAAWARTKLRISAVKDIIKKRTGYKGADLVVYYPVAEDNFGKKDSPYAEYVFLTYVPEVDYFLLENTDEFIGIIRQSGSMDPVLIPESEVAKVRFQVSGMSSLKRGDVVRIMEGPLRGNYGVICEIYVGEAALRVQLGSEEIDASIPVNNLRKNPKKTKDRKIKLRQMRKLSVFGGSVSKLETGTKLAVGDGTVAANVKIEIVKITRIVRRGLKHTRVIIEGQSVLLSNGDLFKIQESVKESISN